MDFKHSSTDANELQASIAFTRQSSVFDELYAGNPIIQYKRERVRRHILHLASPGSSMLELNSGTGEDAVFFANQGFSVHATDLSEGMQKLLVKKIIENKLEEKISYELCSFTKLYSLEQKGPFDIIFSNFAGLNCTSELNLVLDQLGPHLKPGGIVTLVVMPRFCLWETLLLFKGQFKTAFRRFFSTGGRKAHIEGEFFLCWYYSPSYIRNSLRKSFDQLSIEGLCTLVPPSYIEHFAENHPRSYKFLKKTEESWKEKWPWKYIGDYYIISFKKRGEES